MISSSNHTIHPYAAVVLRLLREIIYTDDKEWELLLSYQTAVQHHFAELGLQLHLNEAEGYAYLSQPSPDPDDPEAVKLPRLVTRRPLTYDATLLATLLREALQQFDANRPDESRLILSRQEIQEMLTLFFGEQNDMTRLVRRSDQAINRVAEVGFLKRIGKQEENLYEVKRIIKAKISADKLVEIRALLRTALNENETEDEDE